MWISYLNFRAVLALPKMAHSAQTHKSIRFIRIVWSTLCVYLWLWAQSLPSGWNRVNWSAKNLGGGGDSPPAPSVFTALRLDIEQDGSMSFELDLGEKWVWTSTNMHMLVYRMYRVDQNYWKPSKNLASYIPYALHYKTQLVYFLPHFTLPFILVERLVF